MNTLKKFKMPIIIILVLIVVFFIYSYFKGGSDNGGAVVTSTNASGSNDAPIGQEFVNQLLTLQSVNLDNRIFYDPRFQSLLDFSQPIPDQPQGRPNPFAPIGVDVSNGPTVGSPSNGAGFTFESATSSSHSKSSTGASSTSKTK